MAYYKLTDIQYLHDKLLPLFDSISFMTLKGFDYVCWKYIVMLHRRGFHTTTDGLDLIKSLESNTNNRRLTSNIKRSNITPIPVLLTDVNKFLNNTPIYDYLSGLPQNVLAQIASKNTNSKSIYQYDSNLNLIQVHKSIASTSRNTNLGITRIRRVLDKDELLEGYKFYSYLLNTD